MKFCLSNYNSVFGEFMLLSTTTKAGASLNREPPEKQTRNNKREVFMTEKLLQWHPAFFAGIQIEFGEEAKYLEFKSEYVLGTKPMMIDVPIKKKRNTDTKEKYRKDI